MCLIWFYVLSDISDINKNKGIIRFIIIYNNTEIKITSCLKDLYYKNIINATYYITYYSEMHSEFTNMHDFARFI